MRDAKCNAPPAGGVSPKRGGSATEGLSSPVFGAVPRSWGMCLSLTFQVASLGGMVGWVAVTRCEDLQNLCIYC